MQTWEEDEGQLAPQTKLRMCGVKGHIDRDCDTPAHLNALYKKYGRDAKKEQGDKQWRLKKEDESNYADVNL